MTTINGMPISDELADFLKYYCPEKENDGTLLTAAIDTISNAQDLICMQLGEMEDSEIINATNCLNDIVILKKDLVKLAKLLPIVTCEERSAS